MLASDFEAEVRALFTRNDLHTDMPSIRCVGYRQMWSYLAGEISYDEMVYRGICATRQLAKRQMTWLRGWQGKSTLFNSITNADVYAADKLFATLDPTLRRINVADVGEAVLADTVGFIRHPVPHDLVAAFKATLQKTRQATLLLHVIDAADGRMQENIEAVDTVLEEIEAHEIPTLLVMNKIDALDNFEPRIDRNDENLPIRVWLSAQTGVGISLLFQALTERLSGEIALRTLRLPPEAGRIRSRFYQTSGNRERVGQEEEVVYGVAIRMPNC
ncbi:unnamed protein product [Ranitomeya imitator]|uniref:Hflx-type G domain-containing protein n=1 Tax=Ranitomeya imitator TaxID=111125 RepID=A0ABN9LLT6_9NEOB|nr:unnamed protein product [Ranitomeya imitator]